MERSLVNAVVSSFYQVGASVVLLMAGALLLQNSPLSWHWFRAVSKTSTEFCPDRAAPYSVTTDLYQSFARRSDLYGASGSELETLLGSPACTLTAIAIRADAMTERSVYYREDGSAIVLAFEEGEFVGHSVDGDVLPERIVVAQSWPISTGDQIGGYAVLASLGELSLQTQDFLVAPTDGSVSRQMEWSTPLNPNPKPLSPDCVTYTSPAYPAYLSRFCGLRQSRTGMMTVSDRFGQSNGLLHFALLTLRPTESQGNQERQWHYVAPAPEFVTQFF